MVYVLFHNCLAFYAFNSPLCLATGWQLYTRPFSLPKSFFKLLCLFHFPLFLLPFTVPSPFTCNLINTNLFLFSIILFNDNEFVEKSTLSDLNRNHFLYFSRRHVRGQYCFQMLFERRWDVLKDVISVWPVFGHCFRKIWGWDCRRWRRNKHSKACRVMVGMALYCQKDEQFSHLSLFS